MLDRDTARPVLRVSGDRLVLYGALLLAGLVVACTVRQGVFVPLITDASGYISAGDLWRRHDIVRSESLPFWAPWPNAAELGTPLAYRPGPVRGTEVSVYPPGFPILIGAAMSIAGPLGGYLVAPLMGGLLVVCVFALASLVGGNACGLLAATLIASSPIVLLQAVHPMSDVPAAACWMLAWLLALRGTPSAGVTAGLAASLAMLIRPNLAPLTLVIAVTIFMSRAAVPSEATRESRWRASMWFLAMAAVGPVLVAWSQAVLYGNPFASGYGAWRDLFDFAHVVPNARMYLRLLAQTHTLLPLAGLCLVLLAFKRAAWLSRQARVLVLSGSLILVVNVALYLPYLPFDHWPFLRFLLPGLCVLFVLFAGLVVHGTRFAWARVRWFAVAIPCVAIFVVAQGIPFTQYAFNDWRAQSRIRLMGHYLREVLPANAVALSFAHSGALAYYTGRDIMRLDLIDPQALDRTVDLLSLYGLRPVFVLDQALEEAQFRERFGSSRFGRLDWPARAEFVSATAIRYFDAADRERHEGGVRWPVDVLR